MYTLNFTKINKNSVGIAGGKGASLGEMTQAGIPVPKGYVVLSTAFDEYVSDANITEEIEEILQSVNIDAPHTVEGAAEKIQYLILNANISQRMIDEILVQFKKLNTEFVAVRSSATAEDGVDHAWAGQLSSYLNTTEEFLIPRIKECWASLFSPRAIFYRFGKDLHKTSVSVAVVVQEMIDSEKAGVAFSTHPITENSDQILIEAGYGLGEAVVSGEITPDSYVLSKKDNQILHTNVNEQKKQLIRSKTLSEEGYNHWVSLSPEQGQSQVLSESGVKKLASLVIKIEKHYGFPCDIEWAYQDDNFYITQS
ncbi:MAG: hypothetical protein RLZZ230_562, partial [Candidatus Parcubacteria bacterium]